jgi:two-component system KDP operon response regulator KdpE
VTVPEAALDSPSTSPVADVSILLVEDDPVVAQVLVTTLRGRGYRVDVVENGEDALERVSVDEPTVVLLDLGLPDLDGVEVCKRLRRWYTDPILVVTADGDEARKVAALDEGADDYVTKPFSMSELLARLRVALRHREAALGGVASDEIEVGDLRIDVGGHVAELAGEPLRLTRKEFTLLSLLARNRGRVLTHSVLLQAAWGTTDPVKTATLRVHVTQLRQKLGTGRGRPVLVSDPGVGYRLLAPEGDR